MPEDLVVETNGPYLRVVLPDFEPDWAEVWSAVDFELEEGIERAEVIAPCYPDDHSLAVVREVVGHLERCHVETVVEWQGAHLPEAGTRAYPGPSGSWASPNQRRDQRPMSGRAL
jgi:hypothetical protein